MSSSKCKKGKHGKRGKQGYNGVRGATGTNGINGAAGQDGSNGEDGQALGAADYYFVDQQTVTQNGQFVFPNGTSVLPGISQQDNDTTFILDPGTYQIMYQISVINGARILMQYSTDDITYNDIDSTLLVVEYGLGEVGTKQAVGMNIFEVTTDPTYIRLTNVFDDDTSIVTTANGSYSHINITRLFLSGP